MDWLSLLDDNRIEYVTQGPNTKRGEVSVKCPFCGDDDPSQHMGIALEREAWGCHRNNEHRGKSPLKLIRALLGCSYEQAKLTLSQYNRADPETLEQALESLTGVQEVPLEQKPGVLELPGEFKRIKPEGLTAPYWEYLLERGFDRPAHVADYYQLKACLVGRWAGRIIIPVYDADSRLVAWTGRALSDPIRAPRYLSTSEAIKTCVWLEDELMDGGKLLFITEGPFDALKVDYYGRPLGARATCVFGTSITMDQIYILREITKRFDRSILLMDPDATGVAFNTAEWLPKVEIATLVNGAEDPGAMTKDQVIAFICDY